MGKCKGLILIIFVILLGSSVFAMDNADIINLPDLSVFNSSVYDEPTSGRSFFLFSEVVFENEHTGSIYAFFSDIHIKGSMNGNIIGILSEIRIEEEALINGTVFKVHNLIAMLFFSALQIAVILILVQIKKGYFEQGFGACLYDKFSVLRKGLLGYFFVIALMAIFLFSVVGYPITILVFLTAFVVKLCGQASLSIYIGHKLNGDYSSIISILAGNIIIESICFIPYIGRLFSFVFLPIICIGIEGVCIINALLYKKFYSLPKNIENIKNNGNDDENNHRYRDIILKGIDNTKGSDE